MLDLAVAVPTLIGSVLTTVAAVFVFICYLVLPFQSHFRHTLILSLFIAAFLNGVNKSISGFYALNKSSTPPKLLCSLGGAIGHGTDQAMEFSILAIALASFIVIRRRSYEPTSVSLFRRVLMIMGIWNVPIATSFIGWKMKVFKPIDGNWCWIEPTNNTLRYQLGFGWRIVTVIFVTLIQIYLLHYVHRHFEYLRGIRVEEFGSATSHWSIYSGHSVNMLEEFEDYRVHDCERAIGSNNPQACFASNPIHDTESKLFGVDVTNLYYQAPDGTPIPNPYCQQLATDTMPPLETLDPLALIRRSIPPPSMTGADPTNPSLKIREKVTIRKLLLNTYPLPYILLLIPFLFCRTMEFLRYENRSVRILESSWAFMGSVSAITFLYNERIFPRFREWRRLRRKEEIKICISSPVLD